MEFWNDATTDASWEELKELNKEFRFILIGGWATYLYTRLNKSKDIDIIVDYDTLSALKNRYELINNVKLKKYEIKFSMFDVDIYLPKYSELPIPPQDILKVLNTKLEGFTLPKIEALITLKIAAFLSRKDSIKGKKDAVDILGLLLDENLDIKSLKSLFKKYGHDDYLNVVNDLLRTNETEIISYLKMDLHSFSIKRKSLLGKMRSAD